MADERITLEVYLENGKFKTQVVEAAQGIERIGTTTKAAASGMQKFGTVVANVETLLKGFLGYKVVEFFVKLGTAALTGAAALQKNQIAFTQMLGSAKDATDLIKKMQDFAAKTPFELPGVVEAGKKLIAFGVPADEVIQKLTNLGNASMGNQEQFERLTYAYGKMAAKGKVTMEELNMVTEAGVPILKQLADNAGVSTGEFLKMVEQGKIGFQDVDRALTQLTTGSGQFAGIMELQAQTLGGSWSNLIDTIGQLLTAFGNFSSPAIIGALNTVNEALSKMGGYIKDAYDWYYRFIHGLDKGANVEEHKNEMERRNIQRDIDALQGNQSLQYKGKTYNHGDKYNPESGIKKPGGKGGTTFTPSPGMGANKAEDFMSKWRKAGANLEENPYARIDLERSDAKKDADTILAGRAKDLAEAKLNIDRWYASEKEKIDQQMVQKNIQAIQTGMQFAMQSYQMIGQTAQMYQEAEYQDKTARLNDWYAKEKDAINSSTMSEAAKRTKLAEIEKQYQKKKNELGKKAFEQEKKWKISDLWMNVAQGIVAAWAYAMRLGPVLGPIVAGIMTGMMTGTGIAQSVVINKQKYPEASYDIGSYSVGSDQTARIHQGEMIIPKSYADAVRRGDITIQGGSDTVTRNIVLNIDGSKVAEVVDTHRGRTAQRIGSQNYARQRVYT